jgi:hypothetical protein
MLTASQSRGPRCPHTRGAARNRVRESMIQNPLQTAGLIKESNEHASNKELHPASLKTPAPVTHVAPALDHDVLACAFKAASTRFAPLVACPVATYVRRSTIDHRDTLGKKRRCLESTVA